MRSTITESEAKNCAMTVFLLIDFLQSWVRVYRSVLCAANGEHLQKRDYVIVKGIYNRLFTRIDKIFEANHILIYKYVY